MRIAIDGGALTTNSLLHYGNFTVTYELLHALFRADTKNTYDIYTIDDFKMNAPDNFHFIRLSPTRGWMKLRVSVEQAVTRPDVFVALNQALPFYTSGKIISLSHGLSFMKYSDFYPDSAKKMTQQLHTLYKKSDSIIVSSKKVKADFKKYLGDDKKVVVIPFGIPTGFTEKSLRYKRKKIILYVGMGHPIKQLSALIESFKELTNDPLYYNYLLVLVGTTKEYVQSLDIPSYISNKLLVIPHALPIELIKFYNEASVVVSSSFYESFNLPLLEALSQGTPTVALSSAVIPEMEKYVYVCADKSTLAQTIKKALTYGPSVNLKELHKNFNWDSFAKKLITLYEK